MFLIERFARINGYSWGSLGRAPNNGSISTRPITRCPGQQQFDGGSRRNKDGALRGNSYEQAIQQPRNTEVLMQLRRHQIQQRHYQPQHHNHPTTSSIGCLADILSHRTEVAADLRPARACCSSDRSLTILATVHVFGGSAGQWLRFQQRFWLCGSSQHSRRNNIRGRQTGSNTLLAERCRLNNGCNQSAWVG